MKRKKLQQPALINRITIPVRFSEVDAMQVVWHGEYVRYMEDGREAFGKKYGIRYKDISDAGFVVPIVDLNIQYKQSLQHGDSVVIETRYIPTGAAKMVFEYILSRESDNAIVAIATTTQVFLDLQTRKLELNKPEFYLQWKKRWIPE